MYHALYFSMCTFTLYFPSLLFCFVDDAQKQMLSIKRFILVFGKGSLWVIWTYKQRLRIKSSSHRRYPLRKGVLRNFAKFTGKYLCQGLFFNKVAGSGLQLYLKKRPWHRCFPVSYAKFLRAPFLQNTSGRLLLWVIQYFNIVNYAVKGRQINW